MKVLVTGGAGFIGSHLCDALVAAGHEVVVLDNLSSGCTENLNTKVRFIQMDILSDQLKSFFAEERFDIVFHEAAQTMVPYSMKFPAEDARINITGLVNVLEAARVTDVKKIVFSSSAAVYGNNDCIPLKESEPVDPTSFYGLTKITAERYLQLYYETFGLTYVVLRYSNVYGERQGNGGEGGVVFIFAKALTENRDLRIFGDGNQSRDFIYVKDIVQANLRAMGDTVPVGIYNISSNTEVTINQLTEHMLTLAASQVPVHYEDIRTGDIYNSSLDNGKAAALLGWKPVTSLSAGLADTFDYFLRRSLK